MGDVSMVQLSNIIDPIVMWKLMYLISGGTMTLTMYFSDIMNIPEAADSLCLDNDEWFIDSIKMEMEMHSC